MIPSAARLKRACQDVREKYDVGMQVGLPRIKADVADVETVIKHLIARTEEVGRLREEIAELGRAGEVQRGRAEKAEAELADLKAGKLAACDARTL